MANVAAFYEGDADRIRRQAWVDALVDELRQEDRGAYVNFVGAEGDAGVRAAYPGPTWDRLASIKRRYDPTNLFRHTQNVPPALESIGRPPSRTLGGRPPSALIIGRGCKQHGHDQAEVDGRVRQ
jgi:hypothetical protein